MAVKFTEKHNAVVCNKYMQTEAVSFETIEGLARKEKDGFVLKAKEQEIFIKNEDAIDFALCILESHCRLSKDFSDKDLHITIQIAEI